MKNNNNDLKQKFIVAACLCICSFTISPSSYANPSNIFVDVDLSLASDSNVGQAKFSNDTIDDTITSSSLLVGYNYELNFLSSLIFSAGLKAEQYKELDTQNSASLLANGIFMWQNEVGYRKPIYQFVVNYEVHNNESKQQDSTLINTQLLANSRITDVITAAAGIGYNYRDSESTVYDLTDIRFFASMDYMLNKQLSWYATVSLIQGDTFSIARPDTDDELFLSLSVGADKIQLDEAFNQAFPGDTPWQAYQIDADTQVFVLGLNYGFGHGNSFDLSYTRADVSGDGGAEYERDIISGSLLKRF